MADHESMTVRAAASKLLVEEHADVLREAVRVMLREVMEAEVSAAAGADWYQRSDEREAYRNGYRQREWDTRVGTVELAIPRLRTGSYFPSFLEPRRRSEQALVAVVQEAYINGVSTRKVERLVEQLGIGGMSKSAVSRLCQALDEQVRIFRERPLEGRYPYVWLDAKIERVREPGGVHQKALVIAYAVHETGRREVIGIDLGESESEAFWREFLRSLRARGLSGVRLCVSDAHEGLKKAIGQMLGVPWQRCTVHTSSATCSATSKRRSSRWSAPPSVKSSRPRLARKRPPSSPTCATGSRRRPRRSSSCSSRLRMTYSPSLASRSSTAQSCARPIRWSGSTGRSPAAQTWSASTPTTTA